MDNWDAANERLDVWMVRYADFQHDKYWGIGDMGVHKRAKVLGQGVKVRLLLSASEHHDLLFSFILKTTLDTMLQRFVLLWRVLMIGGSAHDCLATCLADVVDDHACHHCCEDRLHMFSWHRNL